MKDSQLFRGSRGRLCQGMVGLCGALVVGAISCTSLFSVKKETPLSAAEPAAPVSPEAQLRRGLEVYAKQCSACHGAAGLGDGAAAYLLYPKPRNFAGSSLRLTSTASGLPSDEDLLRSIRRGMPGSAMPGWAHLPESDLAAVVKAVRQLAIEGRVADMLVRDPTRTRDKAEQIARKVLEPGALVKLPARPADANIERGKAFYTKNCAACHGADGRGRDRRDLKDTDDVPSFARDFTQGVFKGGARPEDIALRIVRGMPGTPMPGNAEIAAADLWSCVDYVQTFIKPGAEERVLQSQKAITAARVAGPISADLAAAHWKNAPAIFLPVMPLWWRDDGIKGIEAQAVHDGKNIAIRLSWEDATRNDTQLRPQSFGDAVAIQLSPDADPPFFAMGAKGAAVDLWHWKAAWEKDLAGAAPGLKAAYPNMPAHTRETDQGPLFMTGAAAGNPVSSLTHTASVDCLVAGGFGTLTSRGPAAQGVRGTAQWADGRWSVVFVHEMVSRNAGELSFQPGGTVSLALAVWDGEIGERNGQKSVTIWHQLRLAK